MRSDCSPGARTRPPRSAPARAETAPPISSCRSRRRPGGLPLPRPDNAVTWAITSDNEPIPDGVADEGGPLGIYNYADYIDPGLVKKFEKLTGRKVQLATYNSSDEAIAKLARARSGST